jgi:hypothetical protein
MIVGFVEIGDILKGLFGGLLYRFSPLIGEEKEF